MAEYRYKDDNPKRGVALVITVGEFDAATKMAPRAGARQDGERLKTTLQNLAFDVRILHNITFLEIIKKATRVARMDHSKHDCLVVAISTHGSTRQVPCKLDYGLPDVEFWEEEDLLYGTDAHFPVQDLTDLFNEANCPTLKGKPKIFFFQGCRGEKLAESVKVPARPSATEKLATAKKDASGDGDGGVVHMVDGLPTGPPGSVVEQTPTGNPATASDETQTSTQSADIPGPTGIIPSHVDGQTVHNKGPHSNLVVGETVCQQEETGVVGEEDLKGEDDVVATTGEVVPDVPATQPEQNPAREKIVSRKSILSRDYLTMWSCPPGYFAFHTSGGSPFIQHLCEVLDANHGEQEEEEDLLSLLTEVNWKVASEYQSRMEEGYLDQRRIVPSLEHMLLRSVYFPLKR